MPSGLPERARLRALICDLDGTLVDSALDLIAAESHALEVLHLGPPEEGWLLDRLGWPLEELLRAHQQASGAPAPDPALLESFVLSFRAHYYGARYPNSRLLPGVSSALRTLRARGIKLGVATTKPSRAARDLLEVQGLLKLFDWIQGTDPGQAHKPDPEILHLSVAALGLSPEEALFVGDTERDVEAGHRAGCWTAAAYVAERRRESVGNVKPHLWLERLDELLALPNWRA